MTLDVGSPVRKTGTDVSERADAGTRGAGEYHCLGCGYGVVTFSLLPACPMCHELRWEVARRSPFTIHAAPRTDPG